MCNHEETAEYHSSMYGDGDGGWMCPLCDMEVDEPEWYSDTLIDSVFDSIDTEDITIFTDEDEELSILEVDECEAGVNPPTYGGIAW